MTTRRLHDKSGKPGPYDGSVGKTAVAALVAGVDPTHFGGYNLLHALKHDQCTTASEPKNNKDPDAGLPRVGAARNIYSSVSESLAILAEARGSAKYGSTYAPDSAAMSYFLSLQCANGGFTADTAGGAHCASDPDSTGYAIMALQAAGQSAARWIAPCNGCRRPATPTARGPRKTSTTSTRPDWPRLRCAHTA